MRKLTASTWLPGGTKDSVVSVLSVAAVVTSEDSVLGVCTWLHKEPLQDPTSEVLVHPGPVRVRVLDPPKPQLTLQSLHAAHSAHTVVMVDVTVVVV